MGCSWTKLGLKIVEVVQCGLLDATMNALANQHTSVAAAKLLGKLFRSTSCPPTPPELQVLTAFMHQLPQLLNLYLQAVAAGEQGVTICLALSRMINKISSAQLELVAACQLPHTPVMVQLALAGTAHPADAVPLLPSYPAL